MENVKLTKEEAQKILLDFSKIYTSKDQVKPKFEAEEVSRILAAQAMALQDGAEVRVRKLEITKVWMDSADNKFFGLGNDNKMYVWLSWAEEPRWELYVTKE